MLAQILIRSGYIGAAGELLRTGSCPSTPGSGNAYSCALLQSVLDGEIAGIRWLDMLMEVNAPFAGDVVTHYEPLAQYRMHGQNNFQGATAAGDLYASYVALYEAKLEYIRRQRRIGVWLST